MNWVPPNSEYPPPKADEPPLHRAARLGDLELIRNLVGSGVDINAWYDLQLDPGARPFNATPLMVAAGSGYGATTSTMRLLLELGANPKLSSSAGSIAFFAVAGLGWNYPPGGDAGRLQLSLSLGCNPNEKDDRDVSLIAAAAGTGDPARMRLLIEAGADPNPNWNAEAARDGHQAMANVFGPEFLNIMAPPTAASSYQIPLFAAVECDSRESVEILLDAGANMQRRDNQRRTCLFYARSIEVAKLLTSRGADIEARDEYEWTPLKNAVGESLSHVQSLLAVGANPNATCDHGYTVFMAACSSSERSVEKLAALVAAGANPFAVSEFGYNAVHAAVDVNGEANSEASVRSILGYLFELGVDYTHRNQDGQTPLDRARSCGTPLEVGVLEELISRCDKS